jgi:energy-coupling factor transport system substrate-specific component
VSRRALIALLVGAALVAAPAVASAASPLQRAVAYMARVQSRDGGFGLGPGASTPDGTIWAAIGLHDAGQRLRSFARPGGQSLAAAVDRSSRGLTDPSQIARAILARRDAGLRTSGLVARLAGLQSRDGSYQGRTTTTAFAILALRAGGRSARDRAVRRAAAWLAGAQQRNGGFGLARGAGQGGTDVTAAALQGLWRGGYARTSRTIRRAVRYLRGQQRSDGGFPLLAGGASNAQSTAWAVQAFVAAGVNPAKVRRGGSRDPLGYLRSLQAADGSIRYSRTSAQTPVWVTAQALSALAKRPF